MDTSTTTVDLPHRPRTEYQTDPVETSSPPSPSHSRSRRRLLDCTPRPLGPTSPGITTTPLATLVAKRKVAPTDTDPAEDETRRGRSITRSLSPLDVTNGGNRRRRRRRRRSVSPSRGSRGSRSRLEEEEGRSEIPRVKRRRTLDVRGKDGEKEVVNTKADNKEGDGPVGAATEKERNRSRLRARYRRMSEKASAEVRGSILSNSVDTEDPTAAVLDDDEDNNHNNANNQYIPSPATRKENTPPTFQTVFQGWGNIEREEWGVGMRNREEVAGRKAEGRGWLRRSSSEI